MMHFIYILDRARELADVIGGEALALGDLDNYHPEDGMILANTTSIGMQPKVDETPISKVFSLYRCTIPNRAFCYYCWWNFLVLYVNDHYIYIDFPNEDWISIQMKYNYLF